MTAVSLCTGDSGLSLFIKPAVSAMVWYDIACFFQALPCRVSKTVLECRRRVLVTSRILLRPHGIFQALFLASYFFKPSWESDGDEGCLTISADYLVSENTGFNGSSGAYMAYMPKYK